MGMKKREFCLILAVLTGWSFGQDAAVSEVAGSDDPFASGGLQLSDDISPERAGQETAGIEVRIEVFDLPVIKVIELLDARESDGQLRENVLSEIKGKRGKVVEVIQARTEAGLAAVVEGICETIYPTEYEPPSSFPDLVKMEKEAQALSEGNEDDEPTLLEAFVDQIATDATPTAFETRNLGSTVEFLVKSVEAQKKTWDVALAPEIVRFVGERSWMAGAVEMPIFTSWRVSQSFRIPNGEWVLASTGAIGGKESGTNPDEKRLMFLKVEQVR